MISAREKEREYFETSPDYAHLSSRMGSGYLAKLLSQVTLELISRTYIYLSKITYSVTLLQHFSILNLLSKYAFLVSQRQSTKL